MKKRNVVIFLCVLVSVTTLYRFLKATRVTQQNTPLVVGLTGGYAPFVSMNKQGDYEGFDIDIAYALAKQMGKELVIKDLGSMTSLFMALEQGSIDVIIWGLSITQERLQKIAMINYFGDAETSYPLIFWQQPSKKITTLDDAAGMTICVEPTSVQAAIVQKYPQITICATEKVDDALLNIQYAKADAAFVENAVAKKFKNKFPNIQQVDIPLAEDEQTQGIGIAVKKNKIQLIQQVQDAVDNLKRTGIIQQYATQWGIE